MEGCVIWEECVICAEHCHDGQERAPSDAVCNACLHTLSRISIIKGQWLPVPFDALDLGMLWERRGGFGSMKWTVTV